MNSFRKFNSHFLTHFFVKPLKTILHLIRTVLFQKTPQQKTAHFQRALRSYQKTPERLFFVINIYVYVY